MSDKKLVLVLMGSDSDYPVMESCVTTLKSFGVPFSVEVCSAHRTPHRAAEISSNARKSGARVIIAAAGGAAHLAGVLAAHTTLPVLGVPCPSALDGLDSLLATVQMPAGIPVGTLAIGKAGATNAALLAIQILATTDANYEIKLAEHRSAMKVKVAKKNKKLLELIRD